MLNEAAFTHDLPQLRSALRSFVSLGRKAVAALEFALIAPVMALLVIGVFDLARVAILWEQVWSASRSIAESASTLALPVQPGYPNALTWQNAQLSLSAALAEIPWLADGIAAGGTTGNAANATAVLTSVNYLPPGGSCTSGSTSCCPSGSTSYCALVMWSKAYVNPRFNSSSNVLRPCGSLLNQQAAGASTNTQSIDTLPVANALGQAGITVPDPFLIADVSLKYTPYFFNFATGTITLSATSFVPVRTGIPGSQAAPSEYAQLYEEGDPNGSNGSVCSPTSSPPS